MTANDDARRLIHEADPTLACRMQWAVEGPGRHTAACDRLTEVIRAERESAAKAWAEVNTARARLRDGDVKNALARLEMVNRAP